MAWIPRKAPDPQICAGVERGAGTATAPPSAERRPADGLGLLGGGGAGIASAGISRCWRPRARACVWPLERLQPVQRSLLVKCGPSFHPLYSYPPSQEWCTVSARSRARTARPVWPRFLISRTRQRFMALRRLAFVALCLAAASTAAKVDESECEGARAHAHARA